MKLAAAATTLALTILMSVGVASAPAAPTSTIDDAQTYIKGHGADANRVAGNVLIAEIGIDQVSKSGTQANLNKLASYAQNAHDNVDAIRNNFAETGSGALGNAELLVFEGANDLKNSMGALVAWTGDPNAATLAHFTSQFTRGRSEWNTGIKTIWKLAHHKKPPTV
jgi:hypothetical protein